MHGISGRCPRNIYQATNCASRAYSDDTKSTVFYTGPLSTTFRNLKIFSLSSLTLAVTLTPFIFIIEAPLSLSARIALAATALGTSASSTALIGWCGKPYVISMRRVPDSNAVELITTNTLLRERCTTVFDPQFLQPTPRPFATWEIPNTFTADLEPGGKRSGGNIEMITITRDTSGSVLGQCNIEWKEEEGKLVGTVQRSGDPIRHFNVHEELLDSSL
ncbi:transmembrane protein [Ceratobasidium sp. AG-Ba]|nr:transmembrane protein [Ceratobasidium sp. AG-Ba]